MKKIPSLFQRNYDTDCMVRNEVVPGSEWVQAGEGIATEKFDGTACMVRDGKLWKRYDAKKGKTPPPGWEACGEPDPVTGHNPGWIPVGEGPEDKWHREAWVEFLAAPQRGPDGTYELIGPKINGNPYHLRFLGHELVQHGRHTRIDEWGAVPRDYDGIRDWLADHLVEGIVWHHPDGRMVKVKRRDFNLPWPVKEAPDAT